MFYEEENVFNVFIRPQGHMIQAGYHLKNADTSTHASTLKEIPMPKEYFIHYPCEWKQSVA